MATRNTARRDFDAMERRRLEAIDLLNEGLSQAEVARRLKVAQQTVSDWARQAREHGVESLKKAGRAGRKPRLSDAQKAQLEQRLLDGPENLGYETPLWTCERVSHLIQLQFGVAYHPAHVWKLLRQIGWSCQRPVGRALERNEEAIARWKKVTWPALKKKRVQKGGRSSSSTKAV
jgi:transposase